MDFRSLTRRELQALCKKNKIHANITNVAMADALQALDLVEGIEDFLKPSEAETAISSVELPHKSDISSQSVPSTVRRTARRKTVKNDTETSQSLTRTRNSTIRKLAGNEVAETPIMPTVERSAAAKEKQDVQTPGAVLTSQKREAKEKSSVSQVYTIRRSARLAAKRLKESGKQDNERSDRTITFDNFSEAATEGLEVDFRQCSLHYEDEVEKAGIDLKTASDEGLDSKKAKDDALSFEFENLNLLNNEPKVDMPKTSEELATSDNSNEIIENNVDMLLSNKLGEGEELNDDKAKELNGSLDVEPANFVLTENPTNNGLSDGKESHSDECLNVPDSCDVEVGLQDPHAHVTPKSSLGLDQEEVANSDMVPNPDGYSESIGLSSGKESDCDDGVNLPDLYDGDVGPDSSLKLGQVTVSDGMILPKQLKEPSTEQISVSEVEGVDLQCKVQEVVGKDGNSKHISDCEVQGAGFQCKRPQIAGNDMVHLGNEDDPNTEENDVQYKVQEVVGKDDSIKHSSDCEVQGADLQSKGQQLFGNDMVQLDNEDEPNTEEISDLKDDNADHQCRNQEDVDNHLVLSKQLDNEDETNPKEISYPVGEGPLDEVTSHEDEATSEDEGTTQASSVTSDEREEFRGDENGPKAKGISYYENTTEDIFECSDENSDTELTTEAGSESLDLELEKLTGDEKEPNDEWLLYSDDEDAIGTNSKSLDGEGSLDKLTGNEKETNNEGLSYPEDEHGIDTNSLTGDEKETNNEGLSYPEDEDGIDTNSESLDGEGSLGKMRGDEKEPNDEGLSYPEDEDGIDTNSESLDGEGSLEKLTGDEKETNNEGLSYPEDEDGIDINSDSLDGEGPLEKLTGDEKETNNEGLSYPEDEDGIDINSESLDGEGPLEKLRGDEKEPNHEGLSYSEDEDATEARSASSGRKESLSEFAAGDIWQLNNETESKNIESSELLEDASETNMDAAIGDKNPVQEYVQNSAGKEPSGLQNVAETPFVFLESSVPKGGTPLSALAFDHKQIPTGSAGANLGHTVQMICSTPVKTSSIKTPTKTPITILPAGVKSVSDDKENVDNSGRKLVRIKEKKKKHHEDCSPKEITKSNANTKEATRPALQQLEENCLVDSSGNTVEV
nr:high mobility group nucleosome-binding domain-containing protein 5-like [Ipomoea batatas]GME09666.1 high mobility group nucleosome-binding domain-containing protein 5-like [Ipomoea batatas]